MSGSENFDFLTDTLACGQKIDSEALAAALRSCGVTHVLNLWGGHGELVWDWNAEHVPQEDDGSPRTKEQVKASVSYAKHAMSQGGVLYVHCQWGLGRAPSACYAILRSQGLSPEDASKAVNQRQAAKNYRPNWSRYVPSIEEALSK